MLNDLAEAKRHRTENCHYAANMAERIQELENATDKTITDISQMEAELHDEVNTQLAACDTP